MIHVLIAEDYDILRKDIEQKLEATGEIEVVASVSSGRDAVKAYDPGLVDVAILDIEMESMYAGIEAAEEILLEYPDAKIMYLTSHDDEKIVIEALATGVKDYLVKGRGAEDCLMHVRNVNEGKAQLDERIQGIMMGEVKRLRQSEQNLLYFIKNISILTPTEKELIGCFLKRMKVKEIAEYRCVEPVTVKSQIRTLLHKFNVSRSSEIVKLVESLNLTHLF